MFPEGVKHACPYPCEGLHKMREYLAWKALNIGLSGEGISD